jgi:RNA polymerase primary sigma factor
LIRSIHGIPSTSLRCGRTHWPTQHGLTTMRYAARRSAPPRELAIYLQEIDEVSLLSRSEEGELADRIAQGDPHARERLIRANLRLVVYIAQSYLGQGVDLEDLIAEGNLGLMRAVEGYDGQAGTRFCTYASYWIKQSIQRAVRSQGKSVRLPHHIVTLLSKWGRTSAALAEGLGREPSPEEVGRSLRLSMRKLALVAQARWVRCLMACSDDPGEDADAAIDRLADERVRDAGDLLIEADDLERISAAIEQLEEREATVLRMRFGLAPYAPMLGREVGKVLGLTRSRIQQIEKRALEQLVAALKDPTPAEPVGSCYAM